MTGYLPTKREIRYVLRNNPTEEYCLSILWYKRYTDYMNCPVCGKASKALACHSAPRSRKMYPCKHEISILAGTIFEKTTTPLTVWFSVIYDIYESQGKITAKELMRRYNLRYKTAWRMKHLVISYLRIPSTRPHEYKKWLINNEVVAA